MDLASALAPYLPVKIIGIRPGEKLHEVMCPKDAAFHIIEFDDHYVIAPAIKFTSADYDYTVNELGECGHRVPENFEYTSDSNPVFLSVEELRKLNEEIGMAK